MIKQITAAFLVAVLSMGAMADHSQNGPNGQGHEGPGGPTPQNEQVLPSQEQAQGQAQGQIQGQAQGQGQSSDNSNRNTNLNSSRSEGSQAGAAAVSGGNSQGTNVEYNNNENWKLPANTSAEVYANICQNGVSAQSDSLGASIITSDPLCDTIKVAALYWSYHVAEHNHGNAEQAAVWKEKYVEQMKDVETLMEATKEVAIVDRFSSFMIKPVLMTALLIFLL